MEFKQHHPWGVNSLARPSHHSNMLMNCNEMQHPISATTSPIVTGSSVVAFKYKDGIIMATDCLASYGSLARFRDTERMMGVGNRTVLGGSGEISDLQYIHQQLNELQIEENESGDGHVLGPENIYSYMHRLMYHRRSEFKFLWNTVVIGGLDKSGASFLGCVTMKGVTYHSSSIATGFGAYMAQPILRQLVEGHEHVIDEDRARHIMGQVMRVLYYRDARSLNKIQVSVVNRTGVQISRPFALDTHWDFAESIRGYN